MKLHDLLIHTARHYGARTALVHGDDRITYEALMARVLGLADYMREIGLPAGERVAILIENNLDYVAAYFAVSAADLVIVPLDTSQRPDKLREILEDCGASVLVVQARFARHLPKIVTENSPVKLVITDRPLDNLPLPVRTASLEDILSQDPVSNGDVDKSESADPGAFLAMLQEHAAAASKELAAIFYTSGSTGAPKGVMLSHRNLISNTVGTVDYLRLMAEDSVIQILPFYYIYGNSLLLTHAAIGGTVVIDNRFTYPDAVLDTMEREAVTGFSGVPSNFMILLDKTSFGRREFPALRYFTQAGGAMAPEVIRRLMEAFPTKEIYIMYGQTEASPRVTWLPPERLKEKLGSIGIPVPGVEVRIVDGRGEPAAPGVEGEIVVGGDGVMMGYWNQPAEQAEVLRGGRLYTGDLARVDEDGFFFIVGRRKEIIKAGGNRVSAKEVEEAILELPDVTEAAVFGVPDPVMGEAIKAVVVTKAGSAMDRDAIRLHCHARLAVHKVPQFIEFLAELPKYQSGKINKPALKAAHR